MAKTSRAASLLSLLLLAAGVAAVSAQAADPFDRPAELEPDIAFWRNVFSAIDSSQAYLHDSRHLEVVYETVSIPPDATSRDRRRISDSRRDKYRATLEMLATGKRTGLDAEQQRVLALWPAGISNAELKEAAKRIRFQQGLADHFRDGLQRSGTWQPYIIEQLRINNVPVALAALPHVESSFNPEARSHVGAAGLWQFTRSTGQRFMEIDHVVDERRDPYRSSEAAAQLLAYNYSVLGSWPLAITAYNHGVAGMRRAVKSLDTEDIGIINREYKGRTFGFASRNFYVAFLAAYDVERNADKYFGAVPRNAPRDHVVVQMPRYVPARTLAKAAGVDLAELQVANPGLLQPVWDGTKHVPRKFTVRVPAAATDKDAAAILAAIPADQRFAAQTPDQYHKVRRGDSLSVIAARYNASVSELAALNGLKSRHKIRVGQVLRLPFAGIAIPVGAATYTVQPGDSLSVIASRAGVSEARLLELNKLKSRNLIYAGQKLYLAPPADTLAPAAGQPAAAAAVPEPVVARNDAPEPAAANEPEAITDSQAAVAADASLADPTDYEVDGDGSIEILDGETLGHLAEWLGVKTQRLRDINKLPFGEPVPVGRRIQLDLQNVSAQEFTARRTAWHRELQDAFFVNFKVTSTTEHRVRSGESLWVLTYKRYKVPVWLLRQYNPDLDFGSVQAGTRIIFPRIERVEQDV